MIYFNFNIFLFLLLFGGRIEQLRQEQSSAKEEVESKKQETSSSQLKCELAQLLASGENTWQAMRRLGSKSKSAHHTAQYVSYAQI